MDLQALKQRLSAVMPILDANLQAAHAEYIASDISRGAYEYVRSRHETACAVVARDDLVAESAYKACALLAIDLRTGIKDHPQKDQFEAHCEAWWQCYRDAGFTDVHSLFNSPILPDGAVRL